jgi:hypothetical protein
MDTLETYQQPMKSRAMAGHGAFPAASSVIVVKQHMPWDGLSWGQTKYWRIWEREMR